MGLFAVGLSWNDFFLLRLKHYSIPSGSMLPTLEIGDNFLIRRIFRIWGEEYLPDRGDIIVFSVPGRLGTVYVQRVIGLPGERIRLEEGVVLIDDQAVPRISAGHFVEKKQDLSDLKIPMFTEILSNSRQFEVLDLSPNATSDTTREYLVPDGHLFVLGDNRDNAVDSRFMSKVGFVPLENVKGVAIGVYYSGEKRNFVWRSIEAQPE